MRRIRNRIGLVRHTLRAAWWTVCALASLRKQFGRVPLHEIRVAAPPPLTPRAGRGVDAVLRLYSSTCLQRALVAQRWLKSRGIDRDVVVGVTGSKQFRAHAWVDGETPPVEFRELTRLRAS